MLTKEQPTPDPNNNPMRYDPTDEWRIITVLQRRYPGMTEAQIKKAIEELIREGILIREKY